MDAKKVLESYLKPAAWINIAAWVMLLLSFSGLVMAVISLGSDDEADVLPFAAASSEPGGYAYIDAVAVSDWLYNYDGTVYYIAVDADGSLRAAILPDDKLEELTAQQEYWNSPADSPAPVPEPCRLYGLVRSASDSVRESISSSCNIDESTYDEFLGPMLLDVSSSPGQEACAVWSMAAMFLFLMGTLALLSYIPFVSRYKKCIRRLVSLGELDRAAEELLSPSCISLESDRVRMSEHYIFSRRLGSVLRYGDILWCFRRIQRVNFMSVNEFMVACTAFAKDIAVVSLHSKGSSTEICDAVLRRIQEKNPDARIGYTTENMKAYKETAKSARAAL